MDLVSLLFPQFCVSCRRIGGYLCQDCKRKLTTVVTQICPVCERASIDGRTHTTCKTRYSLDGLVAATLYTGVGRQLVHELKFRYVQDLRTLMSQLMVKAIQENKTITSVLSEDTLIIPVPLHRHRENWRGFNQAKILALGLKEELNCHVREDILIRVKKTEQQAALSLGGRRKNVAGAFQLLAPGRVQGKHVLLVDDVWTSGATMRSAGAMVKRGGAKVVWGLVFAQ